MNPALTVHLSLIIIIQAHKISVHKTTIDKNVSLPTPMNIPQDTRQKQRLFPENELRFVVTSRPIEFPNEEPRVKLQTKKPPMPKIIIKAGCEDKLNGQLVTKRSHIGDIDHWTFLIEPKKYYIAYNNHMEKKREMSYKYLQNEDIALDEAYAKESTEIYKRKDLELFFFNYNRRNQNSEKIKKRDFSHPVEKVDDSNEYIFIERKAESSNYLTDSPAYVIQDFETTTEFIVGDSMLRPKRHDNIIEEENHATTIIPGFIYTRRDSRLRNDLVFKNINA